MHHAMGNWERAKTRTGIYYRYDSRTVFYWGSSYLYCMGVRIYIISPVWRAYRFIIVTMWDCESVS